MLNKLKPEDVIKALECCRYGGRCGECPCFEEPNCQALVNDAAIALLREKDAAHKELWEERCRIYTSMREWEEECKRYRDALREKDAEIESLRKMNDALANGFGTVKTDIAKQIVDIARKHAFLAGDNQYISITELEQIIKEI